MYKPLLIAAATLLIGFSAAAQVATPKMDAPSASGAGNYACDSIIEARARARCLSEVKPGGAPTGSVAQSPSAPIPTAPPRVAK